MSLNPTKLIICILYQRTEKSRTTRKKKRIAPDDDVAVSVQLFILDKYFSELQKFWDTEKRLHGGWCRGTRLQHLIATFSTARYRKGVDG